MKNQIQSTKPHSLIRNLRALLPGQRALLLILAGMGSAVLSPCAQAQTCRDGCEDTNTFQGIDALASNGGIGTDNTAVGYTALTFDYFGERNTAVGSGALYSNDLSLNGGSENTATGAFALYNNDSGGGNVANGAYALFSNNSSIFNTAVGYDALFSSKASNNTAVGYNALANDTTGQGNIAIGESAGVNLTTGSNNIDIGNKGVAAEANTIRVGRKGTQTSTYIAGIRGATVSGGLAVQIDTNGRLGTTTSSARYKDNIRLMEKASESILSLKPVTFRYKKELDSSRIPQFGLVAEQVEKVNPDLVVRDDEGKPYSVRYDAVNAMLLNEFLKEHRTVEELKTQCAKIENLEATIAELKSLCRAQAAQLQKVSARLESTPPFLRLATNE